MQFSVGEDQGSYNGIDLGNIEQNSSDDLFFRIKINDQCVTS